MNVSTPQPARHPEPLVKATTLAHLIFERPDLDRAERFLADFGLRVAQKTSEVLYLRGTGFAPCCYRVHRAAKPRFVGLAFGVASREDLLQLSRLPGASMIEQSSAPGGGEVVSLTDPSGFRVEALFGQAAAEPLPMRGPLAFNLDGDRQRVNATQRPPVTPPDILRLGHVVIEVADYQSTSAWYTRHFGLIPSDVQVLPDGSPAVSFFRLDLGDMPADHHSLEIGRAHV